MQDYLGTAWGGLDWGVCAGCECVDIACRCVSVVVAGADVDVAGVDVDVAGAAVDVARVDVDVAGAAVDVARVDVDVAGAAADVAGAAGAGAVGAGVAGAAGAGAVGAGVAGAALRRGEILVRVEHGVALRMRRVATAIASNGVGVSGGDGVGVLPAYVVVGAAAARLAVGVDDLVDRVAYRRRFSWVAGGPVLVSQAIPNISWTFVHDTKLVQYSNLVLSDRVAAEDAAKQRLAFPAEYVPLFRTYLRTLDQFFGAVRVHLLARNDVAMSRPSGREIPESAWVDVLRREQGTFPAAQLSAFLRYAIDQERNLLEERVWANLSRYCRVIRSQLPLFVVSASVLPPLAAWRIVAVAFAGAEVGCCSAEEHRRWIWLVRLVQGASPVFCSPHLAGLALLAGNRHELPGLLACWVGMTGEICHFSGTCNLVYVTRAVAWLHLRPSAGAGGSPALAPRATLLELPLIFPARLIPEAVAVAPRPCVFDAALLDGTDHHVADCDYVDVARANYDFAPSVRRVSYDLAPVVDGARASLSDGCIDGAAYTSDLPRSDWETAYHHGVLHALPWVLGFLGVAPFGLDAAGVFVTESEEEYESEESMDDE